MKMELLIWGLMFLYLVNDSVEYQPVDHYMIDCGASTNTTVDNRVFVPDSFYPNILSTPEIISAKLNSNSMPSTYASELYRTARILKGASHYKFSVKKRGRYWIRLYFFPFVHEEFNMSQARFTVSALNFTLLKENQLGSASEVREYNLNVSSDQLLITFTPSADSFAFVNALEVISLPDEHIPERAKTDDDSGSYDTLSKLALETVERVNMGNVTVNPKEDPLWRLWVSDDGFLIHSGLVRFVSNVSAVRYIKGGPTELTAPRSVYGTSTKLFSDMDPHTSANVSWIFNLNPGFRYLVRFHLCDLISRSADNLFFKVYINSRLVGNLDFSKLTSSVLGAPYSMDVVTRLSGNGMLNVSVGPATNDATIYPNAILNGLEIMKMSNSKDSLVAVASEPQSSKSKMKIVLAVSLSVGLFIVACVGSALILVCRKRRQRADTGHSDVEDYCSIDGRGNGHAIDKQNPHGLMLFSMSKFGYCFPFAVVLEATNNFSEEMVIGVGGFGKVYRGVLKDGTKVAVKRGAPRSHQGLAEFRTEIEMLSQFRHRHLVSLIGYCDEHNEMIIVYEYMEKGTLKDYLYGKDYPSLSWKKRLEICIGSARGLHYLHTGNSRAIIHRDVKSANILLDENFLAKVADFGLSKTGPEIDETHVSTAVKGSFGYLDPEYLTRQQLTEKSDVYSFGVVMFEVLCGRAVIDPSLPKENVNLIEWATKSQKKGQLEELIDPRLSGQMAQNSMKRFVEIAEKCLAEHGVDRPSMGDVLWNLECALQLQLNDENPIPNLEQTSQGNSGNPLDTSVSSSQFSMKSLGDIAGVSMSKVFANMVREDMR